MCVHSVFYVHTTESTPSSPHESKYHPEHSDITGNLQFDLLRDISSSTSWPAPAPDCCPFHQMPRFPLAFPSMAASEIFLWFCLTLAFRFLDRLSSILSYSVILVSYCLEWLPRKLTHKRKIESLSNQKFLYPIFIFDQWFIWACNFRFEIILPQNFEGISPFSASFQYNYWEFWCPSDSLSFVNKSLLFLKKFYLCSCSWCSEIFTRICHIVSLVLGPRCVLIWKIISFNSWKS